MAFGHYSRQQQRLALWLSANSQIAGKGDAAERFRLVAIRAGEAGEARRGVDRLPRELARAAIRRTMKVGTQPGSGLIPIAAPTMRTGVNAARRRVHVGANELLARTPALRQAAPRRTPQLAAVAAICALALTLAVIETSATRRSSPLESLRSRPTGPRCNRSRRRCWRRPDGRWRLLGESVTEGLRPARRRKRRAASRYPPRSR